MGSFFEGFYFFCFCSFIIGCIYSHLHGFRLSAAAAATTFHATRSRSSAFAFSVLLVDFFVFFSRCPFRLKAKVSYGHSWLLASWLLTLLLVFLLLNKLISSLVGKTTST